MADTGERERGGAAGRRRRSRSKVVKLLERTAWAAFVLMLAADEKGELFC